MRPRLQILTGQTDGSSGAHAQPSGSSNGKENSSQRQTDDEDRSKKWWYRTMQWQDTGSNNTSSSASVADAAQLHHQHPTNAFATRSEEIRKCFSEVLVDVPRLKEKQGSDGEFSMIRKSKRQKSVDLTAQELEDIVRFGRQVNRDLIMQPLGVCTSQSRCMHMEDRYTVVGDMFDSAEEPVSYFACFDGHGGSCASEFCMKKFHTVLKGCMLRTPCTCAKRALACVCKEKAFHEAFSTVDKAFVEQNRERSGRDTLVGSTALIAVFTSKQQYWIANVGDSRAVLVHSDGSTIQLTTDHKPNLPAEKERIMNLGGKIREDRVEGILSMSRAIGNSYLKRYVTATPEVALRDVGPRDAFLVLGSDGLWDHVSNHSAGSVVMCAKNAQGAAQSLVRTALDASARGKNHDNLTAIVIDLRRA